MTNRNRKNHYSTTQNDMSAAANFLDTPLVRAMEHSHAMFGKMARAVHEESLRFVNHRLECTGNAMEGLKECEGLSGLIAVHNEYLMGITQDYLEESRRFGNIMRSLVLGASEEVRQLSEPTLVHSRKEEKSERAAA